MAKNLYVYENDNILPFNFILKKSNKWTEIIKISLILMLKRVLFTLLYDQGNFMLSRNFRLQRVGT